MVVASPARDQFELGGMTEAEEACNSELSEFTRQVAQARYSVCQPLHLRRSRHSEAVKDTPRQTERQSSRNQQRRRGSAPLLAMRTRHFDT